MGIFRKCGCYWPKGVPGDAIDEYFANKNIGDCATLEVFFEGKPLLIHCMKEEKYVMKFMSSFGNLDRVPSQETLPAIFIFVTQTLSHNKAKHWVDDHNQ